MSKDTEKKPLSERAPTTGPESSEPGLGSLAPKDGSHQPPAEPTPPGKQPTAPGSLKAPQTHNAKLDQLEASRKNGTHQALTTNQGTRIANDQNSLTAGSRGPTLLEDFILREKITHFDHERIPERIVHARGSAAHGYFQPYRSLKDLTKAQFLSDPEQTTPVFVRFSTVQGGAGSADTVRDIRGFAAKFYTEEGVFDLVGNNTPVFFIQDAHKFPDFVHAVKPEPHNEIPQGQSAHDTFWDYVSLQPETMHNVIWAMSDRGIPRSYRTMEGFGIHTFRLINAEGKATFVRFHWKPVAGKASLLWDESQKLTGRDPDFHRRDLWEAIEAGDFPEYELGLQLIPEEDEFKYDFDILDATKLIPEALVPVEIVGKMVLNRNPDNFFAETEQVAFHPGHIVPGLDFSNDPLLQGLFSPIPTRRSAAWAGRTSMRSRSTVQPALTTTSSVRGCIVRISIPIRRTTSRIPSTITGRVKPHRRRKVAASRAIRSAWKAIRCVSAARRSANTMPSRVCSGTARRRSSSSISSVPTRLS